MGMAGNPLCDTTQRVKTARHTVGELAQRLQFCDGVLTQCTERPVPNRPEGVQLRQLRPHHSVREILARSRKLLPLS